MNEYTANLARLGAFLKAFGIWSALSAYAIRGYAVDIPEAEAELRKAWGNLHETERAHLLRDFFHHLKAGTDDQLARILAL